MSQLIADISKWQGNPNFAAYKNAGFQGVIHKAGGSNAGRYTDSQYKTNAARIRAAGLTLGHYWFNGPGNPTQDADFFVANLTAYDANDLLAADVESEGSMPHWGPGQTLEFARRVLARTGKHIHIYMSASVTRSGGWEALAAEGYPLWVASYGSNNGKQGNLPTIGGWSDWDGWQYTSLFPGLRIDASVFKHDIGSVVGATPGAGTSTGGSTGGGSKVIGRNVSNKSTKWIQDRLNAFGYGLVADNVYGAATTAAVVDYQGKHGLAVDGIAGNQTVTSLAAGGGNPAAGKLAVDGVWGINTTKALQRAIGTPDDGDFGPKSISALQAHLRIKVDGKNGPATHKALQARVGAAQDGNWGKDTTTKLQQALNAGRF